MAIQRHQRCGKRRYKSEKQAIGSAIASSRRGGQPLRVYACRDCGGWHLTKQPVWRGQTSPQANQPEATRFDSAGHKQRCRCGQCAWLADPAA